MHERERHRVIVSAVQDRPVVTVIDMCNLTGASEATIRRDIATLHMEKKTAPHSWWRRGTGPAAISRVGRPAVRYQQNNSSRTEAGNRGGGCKALFRWGLDYHKRRHHNVSNGVRSVQSAPASVHQFVSDCRALAQAFEKYRDHIGRNAVPRTKHRAVAV